MESRLHAPPGFVRVLTTRTRDGFPDFDGSNLLIFVEDVFEFRAERPSASRRSGRCWSAVAWTPS